MIREDADGQATSTMSSSSSTLDSLVSSPMFIFNKGSESQLMAQAQEKLAVNVAGSIFVKKIANDEGAAAAAAGPKKRARAPDFPDESNPKKKAKAKPKTKAKAKAKAGLGGGEVETAADLEADVCMPITGGHRQRKWLDDLLASVRKAAFTGSSSNDKFEPYNSSLRAVAVSQALGAALRFAFNGSININGKLMKEWSKAGLGTANTVFFFLTILLLTLTVLVTMDV